MARVVSRRATPKRLTRSWPAIFHIFSFSFQDNYNALHLAVLHSREDVIKFLLTRRADLTVPAGVSPSVAILFKSTNGRGSFDQMKGQNVLHLVAARTAGSAAGVAKLLLASGAKDFRLAKDLAGYLPVHVSVEAGNLHVTKELLSLNADVQVKAVFGPKKDTAFHAATRRRDVELLRVLSDSGSLVDAVNGDGQTPLHIAAADGDENVVKYLHMLHA